MRTSSTIVLAVFVVLAPATALATPHIATERAPKERRNELFVGMLAGGAEVGDVSGSGVGVQIDAGRRFGDLSVLAEYGYHSVARKGTQSRLGMTARYALVTIGGARSPLASEWWVEAGAGRQRVVWDAGGVLNRNDAVLGFGMHLQGRLGRRDARPRHVGPYLAIRAMLARAPEADPAPPPTCGGPCDYPTTPSRNDVSLFLHYGMYFGR
jgi:hypothetical protein